MVATARALMGATRAADGRAEHGAVAGDGGAGVRDHPHHQRQGVDVLLVEQNALMALPSPSCGYVLESGRVLLSGPAGETVT